MALKISQQSNPNESPVNELHLIPCDALPGVGKQTAERLKKLGIHNVQDLLFHLPLRYQDRTRVHAIRSLRAGDHAVIEGVVESIQTPRTGRTKLLCHCRDASGQITLRFFYPTAFQRQQIQSGSQLRCFGEARLSAHGLEMIHPEFRVIRPGVSNPIDEHLTPIYPATEGVSQLLLRKLTDSALAFLNEGSRLQDILPPAILQTFSFPTLQEALRFVHRPPPDAPRELLEQGKHHTQKRLVFEELLAHRLSLLHLKRAFQVQRAVPLKTYQQMINSFLEALPFSLTLAQQRVSREISQDLNQDFPMLRLVQGDVGSGKTVVAALAMLQTIGNGYQAALMAPTELLAQQHYQTFKKWLEPLNIRVANLTSQMKIKARREISTGILSNEISVVIGTHALFQKGVEFSRLALIIVDEQHRFGVDQRAALREKGMHDNLHPHQLIMTATPIPRTLAMSIYADLDSSIIDELPPGRTPVTTIALSNSRRDEVLEHIREASHAGRQIYWVCTLIEESEILQCQAAEKTALHLREIFPELEIGLLHGRLKATEKEEAMARFKNGQTQLLVATTVIEVGVDVPNASLMVIENAERLGLSQLHQLRGRIGRGAIKSHCVLMYQNPLSHHAKERLAVMRETNDGFKIAECDLKLRGPGEVLGTRQTGELSLRIADLIRDSDLFPAVSKAANLLLNDYPDLIEPLIKRWLHNSERYGRV